LKLVDDADASAIPGSDKIILRKIQGIFNFIYIKKKTIIQLLNICYHCCCIINIIISYCFVVTIENYGRPYADDGKTSGTYYKFAKRKANEMENW
jgi:hypothetical protein